jgi:DNA-binding NarL/FixJ family response regulator
MEVNMARLPQGEKDRRAKCIARVLQRCRLGLSEQEIAQETGLHRRTVNNYLRGLSTEEKVRKNGRYWFPD